jgi:hypothetical protein
VIRQLEANELKDIQALCSTDKWNPQNQPNIKQYRLNLLQEIEDKYAAIEGRPSCQVTSYNTPDPHSLGYHDSDGLHLNSQFLIRNDDFARYQVVETIIHEGEHEFQEYCIQQADNQNSPIYNRIQTDPQFREQVLNWSENQNEYIRPPNANSPDAAFSPYFLQPLEIDAKYSGFNQADAIFAKDPNYQGFKKAREINEIDQAKTEAAKMYGENYEQVLDCQIRDKYLTDQLWNEVRQGVDKKKIPVDDRFTSLKEQVDIEHRAINNFDNLKKLNPQELQTLKNKQRVLETSIKEYANAHGIVLTSYGENFQVMPDKPSELNLLNPRDLSSDNINHYRDTGTIPFKILPGDNLDDVRKAFGGDTIANTISEPQTNKPYANDTSNPGSVNINIHQQVAGDNPLLLEYDPSLVDRYINLKNSVVHYKAMVNDTWEKIAERTGVDIDVLRKNNPSVNHPHL